MWQQLLCQAIVKAVRVVAAALQGIVVAAGVDDALAAVVSKAVAAVLAPAVTVADVTVAAVVVEAVSAASAAAASSCGVCCYRTSCCIICCCVICDIGWCCYCSGRIVCWSVLVGYTLQYRFCCCKQNVAYQSQRHQLLGVQLGLHS